jgi:WD40 repeat protein
LGLGFNSFARWHFSQWFLDKTIKFWNVNNGQCIKTLNGHTHFVVCLLLLRNGHLASGSWDKTIKIWNTDTGECIKTLEGHTDVNMAIRVN